MDVSALLGPGIYALVVKGEIIYVGKAKKLLQRIYTHRSNYKRYRAGGGPTWGKAIYFTHVWIHPCKESDLDRIERAMIAKYLPKENVLLIPKPGRISLEKSGFDFMVMGKDIRPIEETNVVERRF